MNSLSSSNSRQLLIVARRFWPHAGLTELGLADLARNLADAGHQVTVASIRWSRDWCDEFDFHGVRVIRFARPVAGPWSSFRYARAIAKLFSTTNYDGAIVSGLGDEAAAVSKAVDDYTPVVLQVDEGFEGVSRNLHRRHVETCLAADAVVANSKTVADHLNTVAGMPTVSVIEPGLRVSAPSPAETQEAIRQTLTKTHPVLRAEPDQPLVLTFSRMHHDCGVAKLVRAWPNVLRRYPGAKLWLVGDGPQASKIWDLIVRVDVCHSVLLPGFFDGLDDLFTAADLYVHADGSSQTGDGMLRAVAHSLPVLCEQTMSTDQSVIQHKHVSLVQRDSDWPNALLSTLQQLQSRTLEIQSTARNNQPMLSESYSPSLQASRYIELVESLSAQVLEPAK